MLIQEPRAGADEIWVMYADGSSWFPIRPKSGDSEFRVAAGVAIELPRGTDETIARVHVPPLERGGTLVDLDVDLRAPARLQIVKEVLPDTAVAFASSIDSRDHPGARIVTWLRRDREGTVAVAATEFPDDVERIFGLSSVNHKVCVLTRRSLVGDEKKNFSLDGGGPEFVCTAFVVDARTGRIEGAEIDLRSDMLPVMADVL